MEPVKITESKEWSSIDIFLFSNGQQYSPPRKYHLRSEELQWWETTISYLGRTHYGSGHSSIELYALDGTKIDGPLQLTNGAAYVAVEPPDTFINTGYEEYLVKASRSWEKRLAQKSYNDETPHSVRLEKIDSDLRSDKDSRRNTITINIPADFIKPTSLKGDDNEITSPQKSRSIKSYQRPQRKSITSPNQIQKRKSFDTRSSTLRRVCAETDKLLSCPKKAFQKKNEFINQKPSSTPQRKLNVAANQEITSSSKKQSSIKPVSSQKSEAPKDTVYSTDLIREEQNLDIFNTKTDLNSLQNDSERYPVSLNHYEENHLTEDEYKPSTEPANRQNFEKPLKLKQLYESEQIDSSPKRDLLDNEKRKETISIINSDQENKSYNENSVLNCISEKQIIDEYVAHMNKGGLLLLKLKVKLKDCKTIINKDEFKSRPNTTSLSNLPKSDKKSQVDINISFSGELLNSNDQQYTQHKSLQSILNKLYTEETEYRNSKNPRIIILQCACGDYSDNHKCCKCNTVCGCENDKCEVTLNQKLNKTFTSCNCHNESLMPLNKEKAARNETLSQSANDGNESRPLLSNANNTRVKDLAQIFEDSDIKMSNELTKPSNNKRNSDDNTIDKNQRQSVALSGLNVSPVLNRQGSHRDNESQIKENTNKNFKSFSTRSTQTDWCNVLLEARCHANDYYTFHLPSLYMLKHYALEKLPSKNEALSNDQECSLK